MITYNAYAKINLSLDVLRRREDGYHEVKMIMQTIGIKDVLTFEVIKENGSEIELNILDVPKDADLGPIEKNLIYRAARLIMDKYNIEKSVRITLKKSIPVAAGMAGGSTDAAAVFNGLNELLDIGMSSEDMTGLGVKIGADVPYCIMGGTYLSEGIGEILTPIATPPEAVLLIAKPNINVSTKFVYENLHANELKVHPDVDGMIKAIEDKDLSQMTSLLGNVLENVTVTEYPVVNTLKNMMTDGGALGSLMSGSGPTVFGIFSPDDKENAEKCADKIRVKYPDAEVFVTGFVSP